MRNLDEMIAQRQRERETARKNEQTAHICRLIQLFREREDLQVDTVYAQAAGVSLGFVRLINRSLVNFNDLTLEVVENLARPLNLNAEIIVAAAGFTLGDLATPPKKPRRHRRKARQNPPVRIGHNRRHPA